MTSPKQRAANAANAQHSPGPTTPEGRARSSQNAFKNGLASGRILIDGEDPTELAALIERLIAEHQPATETETILVHSLGKSHWLECRAQRLQAEAFDKCAAADDMPPSLPVLIRYETAYHRAFHKSLDAILKLKKSRPQPEIGFVSQNHPEPAASPEIGFVSQNDPEPAPRPEIGFVSQNDPQPAPCPEIGFVSQNHPEPAPPPEIGFVSQNIPVRIRTYTRPGPKVGRNQPCPCRSGKKFKRCCLGKQEAA